MTVGDFDPDAGSPGYVYERLADHIAARIDAGELVPGSRLPGERELAEQYGVALGTARRAVQELRDRGLAVTLPAKGTYLAGARDDQGPATSELRVLTDQIAADLRAGRREEAREKMARAQALLDEWNAELSRPDEPAERTEQARRRA